MDLIMSLQLSNPPATYARGSKCLDYCEALRSAGYEEFIARISYDCGYFFDFDTTALFGSKTQSLALMSKRGWSASNVSQVTEYIQQKHCILTKQNVFKRVEKLMHQGSWHEQAKRIDKDVLEGSHVAEGKEMRFGEPAWSVELAQARKLVSILTKQLSALRTGHDHTEILAKA